jgi:hypothetical protein
VWRRVHVVIEFAPLLARECGALTSHATAEIVPKMLVRQPEIRKEPASHGAGRQSLGLEKPRASERRREGKRVVRQDGSEGSEARRDRAHAAEQVGTCPGRSSPTTASRTLGASDFFVPMYRQLTTPTLSEPLTRVHPVNRPRRGYESCPKHRIAILAGWSRASRG